MKINDINISEYGAELIDRVASTQVITSITDWLDGSVEGTVLRQSYDYKTIRVTFVVKAEDEDSGYKQISKLTEALKKCNIKFDDIDLIFPCVLNGNTPTERLQNGVFKVSYILMNDWGIGDEVDLTYEIPQDDLQEIKVKYIENWKSTAKGYSICYDKNELFRTIAEETVYVEKERIAAAASQSNSWVSFFLTLGVDVDKYKPDTNNTLNGFIDIEELYTEDAANIIFDNRNSFDIYYNRFQKKGLPDLPIDTDYPSLIWNVGENVEGYYFDLGIGQGWSVQDITILAVGRWTQGTGSGSMIGADDESFNLALVMPKASYNTGATISDITHKVFDDTVSGGKIIIQTLEDIDDVPLRYYGFKSSNDGAAPLNGYSDIIFNGVTLDRTPAPEKPLEKNITLFLGKNGKAVYCDLARVQVYYKGELKCDLIPIAGNIKNGFVNTYDTGLYDVVQMKYYKWSKANGNTGATPNEVMPIPASVPTPTPPAPPISKFTVTVVNGTGSGEYEAGTYVYIKANNAPTGKEFDGWVVDSGDVTIVNPSIESTGFIMPESDVQVTANYKEKSITPEILYYGYISDINNEETMGENKGTWSTSSSNGDGPYAYDNFMVVYSVPDVGGEWTIYNGSYYNKTGSGRDKWGRAYVELMVTRGKGASGQYVTFTPTDGDEVRQDFYLRSF